MKANELRIGNYLDFEGEFLPICSLHSDNTLRFVKNGISIGCFGLRNNTIKPIPLTEDILLKCGFEKNKFDDVFELGEFSVRVDKNDCTFLWNDFVIDIRLKTLHRLQNLYFALTNEELNINL